MLIGFVGSPCSGKTTTAAALFSELKNAGEPVEFFPEYAREYIMRMRFSNGSRDLSKNDQLQIYWKQKEIENMYQTMSPNSLTITDGSTLNSYFYGLEEKLELEEELERYDLIFFCRGLKHTVSDDNRVHDLDFSKKLDISMAQKIVSLPPYISKKVHTLWGTKEQRLQTAMEFLNNHENK